MKVFVEDGGACGGRTSLEIDSDGDIEIVSPGGGYAYIKPADLVSALRELGVLPEEGAPWRDRGLVAREEQPAPFKVGDRVRVDEMVPGRAWGQQFAGQTGTVTEVAAARVRVELDDDPYHRHFLPRELTKTRDDEQDISHAPHFGVGDTARVVNEVGDRRARYGDVGKVVSIDASNPPYQLLSVKTERGPEVRMYAARFEKVEDAARKVEEDVRYFGDKDGDTWRTLPSGYLGLYRWASGTPVVGSPVAYSEAEVEAEFGPLVQIPEWIDWGTQTREQREMLRAEAQRNAAGPPTRWVTGIEDPEVAQRFAEETGAKVDPAAREAEYVDRDAWEKILLDRLRRERPRIAGRVIY